MSNRSRTAILTTVGVAVITLVIGVAIGSVAFPMTRTETTTTIQLSTETATGPTTMTSILVSGISSLNTTSNSDISTTCVIPDSGDLFFTLQNSSSGMPLSSVPIQVSFLAPICPPNPHTTATLSQIMTNQSGIAFVEGEVGDQSTTT